MRRFGPVLPLSLLLSLALLAALAVPVRAGEEWCDTDPIVLIVTPAGATVPIYVTSGGLGIEHIPAVLLGAARYTAQPAQDGRATLVQLSVTVPGDAFDGHFATRTVISSGPMVSGTVYARATGYSGQPMAVAFILAVP